MHERSHTPQVSSDYQEPNESLVLVHMDNTVDQQGTPNLKKYQLKSVKPSSNIESKLLDSKCGPFTNKS